jgi:hypothetical protein
MTDPDRLTPVIFGLELGDRISVRLRVPGRSDVIERQCFVRGITHEWAHAPAPRWTTTLALQDASRHRFIIFDDPTFGVFDSDSARFAY